MSAITYTVARGDSLWKICASSEWGPKISGNTVNAKINTLVSLNGISNPNLIYVGQVLKLSAAAGGGDTSSPSTTTPPNSVVINSFGLTSDSTTGRDLFVSWTWHKLGDNHKHFEVQWEWDIPDSTKPNGYDTKYQLFEVKDTWHTFAVPEEFRKTANFAQVFITPIAEQMTNSSGKEIGPYWTADRVGKTYRFADNPPLTPPKPKLEINKDTLVLTASISDIVTTDLDAVGVKFNIVQDNSVSLGTSETVMINTVGNYVSYQRTVEPGHTYKVRAYSVSANGKESGWSDFSEEKGTKPAAPVSITTYRRDTHVDENNGTKTYSVFLDWTPVNNATSYKVEYTNKKSNFDTAGASVPSATTEGSTPSIRIGINADDLGYTYYFRVKAVNADGESDPTDIVELPVGAPPGPPSTWSSSDSAFVGETMELNWIHNPTDNSKQTYAQISFNFNDEKDSEDKFVWNDLEVMVNSTDINDTETVTKDYVYGTAVSYKGNLYFKMDTNHADLKNTKIRWRVRTAGVDNILDNNSWSVERVIYIYEKPTLGLSITSDLAGTKPLLDGIITTFPFYIRGVLSLKDYTLQRPVGYHVQVISNDYYVTVDDVGKTKTINPGDAVYSKYFDTSETLIVEMSANNIDLESGIEYTIYCNADMSTGLAVSNQLEKITPNWVDVEYAISVDVRVSGDSYTALITPYCREKIPVPGGKNLYNNAIISNSYVESGSGYKKYKITLPNGIYTWSLQENNFYGAGCYVVFTDDLEYSGAAVADGCFVSWVGHNSSESLNVLSRTFSVTKEYIYLAVSGANIVTALPLLETMQIELGSKATEYEEYYETYEDGNLVDNVTLSVYRREYDGSYKEIASGIPNNYTSVTDPHPALDFARYRFTAKDKITGALSFWDMAGYPVNGSAVIIQWAEEWSTFDVGNSTAVEGPSWSGSLLKLPYNIKITDNRKREKTLVEYAGREHPVSYYGTQLSESSQWTVEIPADDKDTIYALRRLSLWTGDVYVREPSGMGFWATIEVSFNKSYNDVKIPVSLNVTRVEGGV